MPWTSTNKEITRQKQLRKHRNAEKRQHTEKPKYTEKEIKSTYDTKKQTAKYGKREGVETKTHLTNKEKEKQQIKELKKKGNQVTNKYRSTEA